MKIAATCENGNVFPHFGRTPQFKLYETADGEIRSARVVDTDGSGHGALAGFLRERRVEVVLCGGIGPGAQNALAQSGISLYAGVTGSADEAVKAFLSGRLDYDPSAYCDHRDHHGEGHVCGADGGHCH